mgnify:CR=1 FL=1
MKQFLVIVGLLATPVTADPLGLIDYDGLFEENAADVEVVNPERAILALGDVVILRGNEEEVPFTSVDQSGEAAVGCFVGTLASLESAYLACELTLTPEQAAIRDGYLSQALTFYSENAFPPVSLDVVQDSYDALVMSEIELSRPFCADPDVITDFAARLFAINAQSQIERMMSVPRLPAANPCL